MARPGRQTISGIFLRRLTVVVVIGMTLSILFTYLILTRQARQNADNQLQITLEDIRKNILDESSDTLLDATEEIAHQLDFDLNLPENEPITGDLLQSLMNPNQLSEINIISPEGIITASTNDALVGFNMASSSQSAEFLELLSGRQTEYVQNYQAIGFDSSVYRKYAARLLRRGGMVQVGINAEIYHATIDTRISTIAHNRHVGETGYIIVADEQDVLVSESRGGYGQMLFSAGLDLELDSVREGASFHATVYEKECTCRFLSVEGYRVFAALPDSEILRGRNVALWMTVIVETVIFLAFFVILWILMRHLVIRNMNQVNAALSAISAGQLETVVDVRETTEFSHLSDDINRTVDTLKRYIAEAAARIDQELKLARAIQDSALPRTFPPYPDRKEFDIFASMIPARNVGGDFYDFFLTDMNHLALVIADVSGKGIPAAMFMMSAKTMIKNRAMMGGSPAAILEDVNHQLCAENDAQLFVTVWLAILDLRDGSGVSANAGHEHPVLRRADGAWEFVRYHHSPVLGVLDGIPLRERTFQLAPGEAIFVYTDGVPEATNGSLELFGDDRLLAALNRYPHADMQTLLPGVKAEVDRFVGGAEQFDDLTMLGIAWFGPPREGAAPVPDGAPAAVTGTGSAIGANTPAAGISAAAGAAPAADAASPARPGSKGGDPS